MQSAHRARPWDGVCAVCMSHLVSVTRWSEVVPPHVPQPDCGVSSDLCRVLCYLLYPSAGPAMKTHLTDLVSHVSGGCQSKTKVLAGLLSLLGLQMAAGSLCPCVAFSLCVLGPGVSSGVQISSYRDSGQNGSGPTLMASF